MVKSTFKFIIIFFLVAVYSGANAQLSLFHKYSIGVSAGIGKVYGDVSPPVNKPFIGLSANYNQTPFINLVGELQFGTLTGGNLKNYGSRQFDNKYTAAFLRGQVQAGEFLDYSAGPFQNFLKNFYASTGIGAILNNTTVQYNIPETLPEIFKHKDLLIPVRIGYEAKIFNSVNEPIIAIDIAYQNNYSIRDYLDGLNTGQHKDILTQYQLGIKVGIKGKKLYRKSIRNQGVN